MNGMNKEWNLALPEPIENFPKQFIKGRVLGAGGFGRVYACTRVADGKPAAVTEVPAGLAEYLDDYDRTCCIIKEVQLLRGLSSVAHIPKVLGYFRGAGLFSIVMERPLNSDDLFTIMCNYGRLNDEFALTVLENTIQVLIQAAKLKIADRDIKLENILVNEANCCVTVIDWGCGAMLRHKNPFLRYDNMDEKNIELFPFHKFVGTREYTGPEYYVEHKYWWESSTVWQLGVLLYVMNQDCFPFNTPKDSIKFPPPFPKPLDTRVRQLIERCLKKDPTTRPCLYELLGATNKLVEAMRQTRLKQAISAFGVEDSTDMEEMPIRALMTV